ncbi:MAG: hypothetical protein E6K46_11410 [Gammaproteobacteria bacterium]|nr:MAG: hypothetical protein E6K46_11410 [Gammaproteobacteria bacterium]
MATVSDPVKTSEELAAELEAYNRAFSELELPWRWDAQTLRHLLTVAPDRDCVPEPDAAAPGRGAACKLGTVIARKLCPDRWRS